MSLYLSGYAWRKISQTSKQYNIWGTKCLIEQPVVHRILRILPILKENNCAMKICFNLSVNSFVKFEYTVFSLLFVCKEKWNCEQYFLGKYIVIKEEKAAWVLTIFNSMCLTYTKVQKTFKAVLFLFYIL